MHASEALLFRNALQAGAMLCLFFYTVCCLWRFFAGGHQKMKSRFPAGALRAERNHNVLGSENLEKGDFLTGNLVLVLEPYYIRVRADGKKSPPWLVRLEIGDEEMTLTVLQGEVRVEGQVLRAGSPPVRTVTFTVNGIQYYFDRV